MERPKQYIASDRRRKQVLRWGQLSFLPMVLISLGIWSWLRWQAAPIAFESRSKLPQHDRIQVYFNHNSLVSYEDPYRKHQRPGDNLEQIIIDQIEMANTQIDVAVQELRSPLIAKALRDRHQSGVRVRVVLENIYSRAWSDYTALEVDMLDDRLRSRYRENFRLIDHNNDQSISAEEAADYDAIKILESANIEFLDDTEDGSKGSGLVHHKFVIIDQQTVVTTSANFTLSDLHGDLTIPRSQGNANSLLVMKSPELAQAFTTEFELLWGDGPSQNPNSQFGVNKPHREAQRFQLGDADVWVKFSPDSESTSWDKTTNGFISEQLETSQDQVNLALFVFSDQQIANQLAIASQNGVKVKALIDHSFAFRPYSEGLDMLGVELPQSGAEDLNPCQTEDANQPWINPIKTVGTPKLAPGDLLHHKFGVIDESVVIMGSHNWSAAANHLNDETLVAIAHPTVAAHFQREFDRLYTNSRLGLPAKIENQWHEFIDQCSSSLASSDIEIDQPELELDDTSKIDLNTATQEELETLPGVGEKTAQAIIEARESKKIESLADLDLIPGIGPKTLEKLGDLVAW